MMIEDTEKKHYESIVALNMALRGNFEENLTEQESERNISRNIVGVYAIDEFTSSEEAFNFNGQGGSGLMITTNGWVITAYHCIAHADAEWKRIVKEEPVTNENVSSWIHKMRDRYCVIDQKGERYAIDISFWMADLNRDIALIKAVTGKRPDPIRFKVVDKPLSVGAEVKLFGLRDHIPYNQYGRVICKNCDAQIKNGELESKVYDTFLTDAYAVPGFSGGVFTDLHGRFAGLELYSKKAGPGEIGCAGGAKAKNISYMVNKAAYDFGSSLLMS
jgi:hypothetical protein